MSASELAVPIHVICDENIGDRLVVQQDRMLFDDGSSVEWVRADMPAEKDIPAVHVQDYKAYRPNATLVPNPERQRRWALSLVTGALLDEALEQNRPELLPATSLLQER